MHSENHRKLFNGSIDYTYYDRRAREIRSADTFAIVKGIADKLGALKNILKGSGRPEAGRGAEVHRFPVSDGIPLTNSDPVLQNAFASQSRDAQRKRA